MKTDFKYISLDLTEESRTWLLEILPNVACFQGKTKSEVLLDKVVLLRDFDVKHFDKELVNFILQKYKEFEGEKIDIKLTRFGWDNHVMAFQCTCDIPTIQDKDCVCVISVYNYHNPKEAKSITKWIDLQPIYVTGILNFH